MTTISAHHIALPLILSGGLWLSGCALLPSRSALSAAKLPAKPGVPQTLVSRAALDRVDPPGDRTPRAGLSPPPVAPPEMIVLPAAYRLVVLDGQTVLVRETDEAAMRPAPASMRIVTGEIARGELSYQPALLPQEIAQELVKVRRAHAQHDEAAAEMNRRADELVEQARLMQEQNRILVERLAQIAAYAQVLEGEKSKPAATPTQNSLPGPPPASAVGH